MTGSVTADKPDTAMYPQTRHEFSDIQWRLGMAERLATLEEAHRMGLREKSESHWGSVQDRNRVRKLELSMAKIRADLNNLRLIVKLLVLAALVAASVTWPDAIALLGLM